MYIKTYLRNKSTRESNTKIDVTEIGFEVLDYFSMYLGHRVLYRGTIQMLRFVKRE